MPFNPPPNWPVSPGFTPGPDWSPDPTWPPAPPGWQFWTPEEKTPTRISRHMRGALPAGVITFTVVTLLGGTLLATWSGTSIRLLPVEQTPRAAPLTFVPNHSDERYLPETWHPFGGIDAEISTHGRSVTLDTQDTTDTWTTKWSGVEMSGPATCSVTISGRVRDMSHRPGVPGGYGIGLAKVDRSQAVETLYGSAVQYDFGQQGYRLAEYPSDTDTGLIVASLDNGWHSFVVRIDSAGFAVFELDGVEVVNGGLTPTCGQPVIRVWAGAAEFTDLDIKR